MQWLFEGICSFSKQHLLLHFILHFLFFTQVQVQLIEVSCFTCTTISKLLTPFDLLVFDLYFHSWSNFEFYHMLFNALAIIIWNRITKILVKLVDKASDFLTFGTFVTICVVRKMEISQNLFKSQSIHYIYNALITNCPHSRKLFIAGSLLIDIMSLIPKNAAICCLLVWDSFLFCWAFKLLLSTRSFKSPSRLVTAKNTSE